MSTLVGYSLDESDDNASSRCCSLSLPTGSRDKEFRFKELVIDEDWSRNWEWIDLCVDAMLKDLVKYLEAPLVEVKGKQLRPVSLIEGHED